MISHVRAKKEAEVFLSRQNFEKHRKELGRKVTTDPELREEYELLVSASIQSDSGYSAHESDMLAKSIMGKLFPMHWHYPKEDDVR